MSGVPQLRFTIRHRILMPEVLRFIKFQPWAEMAEYIFKLHNDFSIIKDYRQLIKDCEWLIEAARKADKHLECSADGLEDEYTLKEYACWLREALECDDNGMSDYDAIRAVLLMELLMSICNDVDLSSDFKNCCEELIQEYQEKIREEESNGSSGKD